ncbi:MULTISPECIES: DUF3515 domain-containing protein [unclassified Streptomyces]|uniref:DUF3515 domain-containing protein n=1 Tax=unclassified Streptomyces TaxID=2593676 RepID=UPI001F035BFB|nr:MULTISPECIES: DUF3515 domain-containing protein [unclassified Streptomyces]MCH0565290.1 DUF3515 domain-containing protein [Streptomyces sp. MUM 2J]MCH0570834.1 DUF3515 domain-containing protein [Streptomyces sp. MUM 136J]
MSFSRHRPLGLPVLALLIAAAAGCSSTDDGPAAAVPSPGARVSGLCRDLDRALPSEVDGRDRRDPEPASALTAGWGDPAIILRCGVPRPASMSSTEADGVEVDGVGWLVEKQDGGAYRFTTTLRTAYVEVTLPAELTAEGVSPLVDLAPAVRKTVPEGIAD